MKEIPILFSGPMVRAILDGRKTETRRVAKLSSGWSIPPARLVDGYLNRFGMDPDERIACPYGKPGSVLWVRETWTRVHPAMLQSLDPDPDSHEWSTVYKADANGGHICSMIDRTRWKPSIHMPRFACRLRLEVVSVRVERLQEITEDGAMGEGIHRFDVGGMAYFHWRDGAPTEEHFTSAVMAYRDLWESLNAKLGLGWDVNPWVWVIQFRRIES